MTDSMTVGELIEFVTALKSVNAKAEPESALKSAYIGEVCMVRTFSAGVFYGTLTAKCGKECRIENARRVWYWSGAASLSELAQRGPTDPSHCKFPAAVSSVELTEVIEVIPITAEALKRLNEVPVWTK